MRVNRAGRELIKAEEGWRSRAYRDTGGIWTIGYGHTSAAGLPKVKQGMKITRAEGEKIFREDLRKFERACTRLLPDLNENQFAAMVSFCYNVGVSKFRKSSVYEQAKAGNHKRVPQRLNLWVKGRNRQGKLVTLRGLVRRRATEGALYAKPDRRAERDEEQKEALEAQQTESIEQDTGEPMLKSKTGWSAVGLSGIAAGTSAASEIADNTMSMMDYVQSPAVWLAILCMALGGFIVWDRWIKKKEFGA